MTDYQFYMLMKYSYKAIKMNNFTLIYLCLLFF